MMSGTTLGFISLLVPVYTIAYEPKAIMSLLRSIFGFSSTILDTFIVSDIEFVDVNVFNVYTMPYVSDLTISKAILLYDIPCHIDLQRSITV